ncbi:MAG: hypothetical protein M1833_000432 [Piccolia ochrophora]|nr:MAG: hypothetical protein M1833_000432 [Piccolia ochrophora]
MMIASAICIWALVSFSGSHYRASAHPISVLDHSGEADVYTWPHALLEALDVSSTTQLSRRHNLQGRALSDEEKLDQANSPLRKVWYYFDQVPQEQLADGTDLQAYLGHVYLMFGESANDPGMTVSVVRYKGAERFEYGIQAFAWPYCTGPNDTTWMQLGFPGRDRGGQVVDPARVGALLGSVRLTNQRAFHPLTGRGLLVDKLWDTGWGKDRKDAKIATYVSGIHAQTGRSYADSRRRILYYDGTKYFLWLISILRVGSMDYPVNERQRQIRSLLDNAEEFATAIFQQQPELPDGSSSSERKENGPKPEGFPFRNLSYDVATSFGPIRRYRYELPLPQHSKMTHGCRYLREYTFPLSKPLKDDEYLYWPHNAPLDPGKDFSGEERYER